MTRYIGPEYPEQAYSPQGLLRELKAGDFFKCGVCRRYQLFGGVHRALEARPEWVRLCCGRCQATAPSRRWYLPAFDPRLQPKAPPIGYPLDRPQPALRGRKPKPSPHPASRWVNAL